MLGARERSEIERLWARKLAQDEAGLPIRDRHRNLEPVSAEFLHALAIGLHAKRMLEIGGSTGISTIALGAAARDTQGQLTSIEIDPARQEEASETIKKLDLGKQVSFIFGDAGAILPSLPEFDLAFIDCEKEDYIRFFEMLRMPKDGMVVADNIISHGLTDYATHVRRNSRVESITLPIGKGLELTCFTT